MYPSPSFRRKVANGSQLATAFKTLEPDEINFYLVIKNKITIENSGIFAKQKESKVSYIIVFTYLQYHTFILY
jgi:hypothetical protein